MSRLNTGLTVDTRKNIYVRALQCRFGLAETNRFAPLVRQRRTVLDLYKVTGSLLGLVGLTTVGTCLPGPSDMNVGLPDLPPETLTRRGLHVRLALLSTTEIPMLPGAGVVQSRR